MLLNTFPASALVSSAKSDPVLCGSWRPMGAHLYLAALCWPDCLIWFLTFLHSVSLCNPVIIVGDKRLQALQRRIN